MFSWDNPQFIIAYDKHSSIFTLQRHLYCFHVGYSRAEVFSNVSEEKGKEGGSNLRIA